MRQDLLWHPKNPTEFSTLYTNKSVDRLRPGELQQVSNMSFEALGALKKIRGNSEIATSTVTQSTEQSDDTDTVDVYWYSSTAYNGSFLKRDYIGIKFKDSFFSGLSGTVSSAQLQLTTGNTENFTGTLYLATSAVSESGSVPTYSTSTSVSVSGSGGLGTLTLTIPAAWITSMVSNNYGMVLVYDSGAGFFVSSSDVKVRYLAGSNTPGDTISVIDRMLNGDISGHVIGTLSVARSGMAAYRGSTYSFYIGGLDASSVSNVIDELNLSALSQNASDSGDVITARRDMAGVFGSTYGFSGGGRSAVSTGYYNQIEYTTLANQTGNAADTGDLTVARAAMASVSGSTYGFWLGGLDSSSFGIATTSPGTIIDYITLATATQNAIDSGDLLTAGTSIGGCMSSTYGYVGGLGTGAGQTVVEKITLATATQNAVDTGDISSNDTITAVSGDTSGIWAGSSNIDAMLFATEAFSLGVGTHSSGNGTTGNG